MISLFYDIECHVYIVSINGPLLFLTNINDAYSVSVNLNLVLHAYDITINATYNCIKNFAIAHRFTKFVRLVVFNKIIINCWKMYAFFTRKKQRVSFNYYQMKYKKRFVKIIWWYIYIVKLTLRDRISSVCKKPLCL